MSRRKRSHLTEADCMEVFRAIAKSARRFGETSDASIFSVHRGDGAEPMRSDEINLQLCVTGSFGAGDEFFEAIRVLAGHKLPARS